jgi:hypothetical protein
LQGWLVEMERADCIEAWRDAHPGRALPDCAEVRRWAIEERNKQVLALMRERCEVSLRKGFGK